MNKNLKILFVSSEVVPYAKTGGLAYVAESLPKTISQLGHDIRIVLPKYKSVDDKKFSLSYVCELNKSGSLKVANLPETNIKVYFIQNDKYYNRDRLYGTEKGDYPDNAERFIYFCKSTLEFLKKIDWKPDCIHLNDWPCGLVPVYLELLAEKDNFYKNMATVWTIHNLAYQGIFSKEIMKIAELPLSLFTLDKLEFWGMINFMKAGLIFSDLISTVSEAYSKEIQNGDEFGMGLEGVLKERSKDLYGIINGIDYNQWNPETDKNLPLTYNIASISKKLEIKKHLLNKFNIPFNINTATIGLVTRLDNQKGIDIFIESIDDLMKLNVRFIILGSGERKYHESLKMLSKKYPEKICISLKFDEKLAHIIYSGSDFILMPSKFEPCGLAQLISFRYGTVPIVRAVGGLADTVKNFDINRKTGSGFTFSDYSSKALIGAVKNALEVYNDKKIWSKLIVKNMKLDFSWKKSAEKYIELYGKAIRKNTFKM
ncbi:MAG: glycogen synthase GlgA [Candidatus Firestonebacteria bacterium]